LLILYSWRLIGVLFLGYERPPSHLAQSIYETWSLT
jgi:hypothetical protein